MFGSAARNDESTDANTVTALDQHARGEVDGLCRGRCTWRWGRGRRRCRCRGRGWPGKKGNLDRFDNALAAVTTAAPSASADVEVLSGWQIQICQPPVAADWRAVTQRGVARIVGRIVKSNARELRAGAAARPRNGSFRNNQVLQRRGIVRQTAGEVAALSAYTVQKATGQNLAIRLERDGIDTTVRVRVERIRQSRRAIEPGDAGARLPADAG